MPVHESSSDEQSLTIRAATDPTQRCQRYQVHDEGENGADTLLTVAARQLAEILGRESDNGNIGLSNSLKETGPIRKEDSNDDSNSDSNSDSDSASHSGFSADVYDCFIHTLGDCAPFVPPLDKTVIIALLRQTAINLNRSSIVPWHSTFETFGQEQVKEDPASLRAPLSEPDNALTASVLLTGDCSNVRIRGRRRTNERLGKCRHSPCRLLGRFADRNSSNSGSNLPPISASSPHYASFPTYHHSWRRSTQITFPVMLSRTATATAIFAKLSTLSCKISPLRSVTSKYHLPISSTISISTAPQTLPSSSSSSIERASVNAIVAQCNLNDESRNEETSSFSNSGSSEAKSKTLLYPKMQGAVRVHVRTRFFGTRLHFDVSFAGDSPCNVCVAHRGLLASRHVNRFTQLVSELRASVDTFERELLLWECSRRTVLDWKEPSSF